MLIERGVTAGTVRGYIVCVRPFVSARVSGDGELGVVTYVGWFNHRRLHSSIGNRPPIEYEREHWAQVALGVQPLPAQAAPTVTDLRDVRTVASPLGGSEESHSLIQLTTQLPTTLRRTQVSPACCQAVEMGALVVGQAQGARERRQHRW